MEASSFPLRWESTGDKWWYACPIDWAAANGHFDLVQKLLQIDGNHLINLTSLRRLRRLESVWDNNDDDDHVAKCRSQVAHQLYDECHLDDKTSQNGSKNGRNNSLLVSYGGWLLYTAASAGDLGFVLEILGHYPLLVFGEGEYGLTDMLYAAAKSKNHEVFRVIYDFALSPRFLGGDGIGKVPLEYRVEIRNRAVHAAARGGNLSGLKELLGEFGGGDDEVVECRDAHGCTILHAAAGKGQVEVVKHLIASYDMISSVDDKGNTPLHVAAYKSQLSVLEALIQASPSSASTPNNAGDTFLHMAVSGFQNPGFRRLDPQIELMRQLVSNKCFNLDDIVNSQNNEGRTALHLAIIGNVHSTLVEILMTSRYIHLSVRDDHGMTPLDYLKQHPKSSSSEVLIRQLISAGGISSCRDFEARRALASQLKLQGVLGSPGTSFRVSDNELFLSAGMQNSSKSKTSIIQGHFRSISSVSQSESNTADDYDYTRNVKKSGSFHSAARHLKRFFSFSPKSTKEEMPVPLRQRYSNASSSPSNNKRTLDVRSNISSPTNHKKFAAGGVVVHDVSPSSSSSSSLPSQNSIEKSSKGSYVEQREMMTRRSSMNPALCFGGSRLGKHSTKQPVDLMA